MKNKPGLPFASTPTSTSWFAAKANGRMVRGRRAAICMIGTIAVSVIGLVHKVERGLMGENRLLMIRGEYWTRTGEVQEEKQMTVRIM